MLNLDSIDAREDFKWSLIHKAHKEPKFKSLLRSEPAAALKQVLSNGDAGLTMKVHQETPSDIYCLINYRPGLPASAAQVTIQPDDDNEAVLVKKAWKSEAYRDELLANPEKKFAEEFGAPMPAGRALHVLEENRETLHLILPAALSEQDISADASAELSDAELAGVSGGGFWSWLATKIGNPPSASGNSGSCGCYSASGVRG